MIKDYEISFFKKYEYEIIDNNKVVTDITFKNKKQASIYVISVVKK